MDGARDATTSFSKNGVLMDFLTPFAMTQELSRLLEMRTYYQMIKTIGTYVRTHQQKMAQTREFQIQSGDF